MIIVGAPVHARAWILADWFDALANQENVDPKEMHILLNYGPDSDGTIDILNEEVARHRFNRVEILVDSDGGHQKDRFWSEARYVTMTRLRNELLKRVREEEPDYYLSCDTDMLLPAHTLRTLFAEIGRYDAIAPVAYMTEYGESFPNAFSHPNTRATVPAATQKQHAVFGTVLMGHAMYSKVDYAVHFHGEDLGWAANASAAELTMALCPLVKVKHVMSPEAHGLFDPRVGF